MSVALNFKIYQEILLFKHSTEHLGQFLGVNRIQTFIFLNYEVQHLDEKARKAR